MAFVQQTDVFSTQFTAPIGLSSTHLTYLCIVLFLIVSYLRILYDHFTIEHHLCFEFAIYYWHLVDVVWLFVFVVYYWWGS